MRKKGLLFLCLVLAPTTAMAQGAAPELFGVREVSVEYARFDDPKMATTCGLSREHIAEVLNKALTGTGVPYFAAVDAKPQTLGVARIQLIPQISSYTGDNLSCVSFVSLSAQSHTNAVIPPVPTLRSAVVIYWEQHTRVATNQSLQVEKIDEVLQKMATQFAQQYRLDQPPDLQNPAGAK
jgi:hypothetical protein